jgi:lipopolysaccharide/colanic/teichoic acid biosynthesis glycosyltransferase
MSSPPSGELYLDIESERGPMVKRLFDLVVACIDLILLAPVLLVAGLLIKLDSPGPVFYRGARIGKDGEPFKIYKLRTMVADADRMGSALTHGQDPRITRVGRMLRKWKIDEFPQLLNVLRGEMSVVGPRPESPGYVKHYTSEQRQVLQVKPGITGLTQVRFRHEGTLLQRCANLEEEYIGNIMPQKLALDLEYIEDQSLLLDVKLILQTFLCLFQTDEFTARQHGTTGTSTFQDA